MIILENDTFKLGKDFVEAATGPYRTKGAVETHEGGKYGILSALCCADTSDALILAARKEGKRLLCVTVQAM